MLEGGIKIDLPLFIASSVALMVFAIEIWRGGEKGLGSSIIAFSSILLFIICIVCEISNHSDITPYSFIIGLILLIVLLIFTFFGRHFEIKRKYKKIE